MAELRRFRQILAKKRVATKKGSKKRRSKTTPSKGEIRFHRSGAQGGDWQMVDSEPRVTSSPSGGEVVITANVSVEKKAQRQTVIAVQISDAALIHLFETRFGVTGMGIGALVEAYRESRKVPSILVEVIDDIRQERFRSVESGLERILEELDVFVDSADIATLRKLKRHSWKK